ncbi:unnamed protein product [Ceutorhynchus assimilis]|uniref:Uncharacterized protein n=1 Tax=Ceutorhynchus assimilis TaxID=467358 RepID=A0A9N9MFR6_9CUCU|nr:unnamed protein product [Ceutorhynchus assimilis]
MLWKIFGFFLILGTCLAEIELPNHPTNLDEVPAIKQRCEEKGKTDTYDRLKVAINETRKCLETKIDPTKVKDELEEAKKTGSMDEVFSKYCNKRSEYKECILKTVNVTKECMDESESNAVDTVIRVIEEIGDFACYRDGDRLAMFIAEGGSECVSSRSEQIKTCINETLKIDTSSISFTSLPTNLPNWKIDKKKCDDLKTIQDCVVTDLEKNCKDTTPANIIDALFKFVKKTTCKNIKKRNTHHWKIKRDLNIHAIRMINSSAIHQRFAEECKKNGGEEAYDQFWNALHNSQSCFEHNRIFVTPKQEYLNTLRRCTDDHVTKLESCFPDDLKFYPKLLIEVVEALIGFSYDHLNLNKLTPQSDIVFCLQRLRTSGAVQNLSECIQGKTPVQSDVLNYQLPNKTSVCKLWGEMDECFNNFIKRTCAPDIAVDVILGNFTEALLKPCRT